MIIFNSNAISINKNAISINKNAKSINKNAKIRKSASLKLKFENWSRGYHKNLWNTI